MVDDDPVQIRRIIKQLYAIAGFSTDKADKQEQEIELARNEHALFVYSQFNNVPAKVVGVDSGQPWIVYWLSNALHTLACQPIELSHDMKLQCVSYLKQCYNKQQGAFMGSPGLMCHAASSYAAFLAIVNLGIPEAYDIIDREATRKFLHEMKNKNNFALRASTNLWKEQIERSGKTGASIQEASLPGSFVMHENGEMDMRGIYCCVVMADILGLLDEELTDGVSEFIQSCQTFEGGLSCIPFGEAHGGYNFCGFAALTILGETHKLNLDRMIEWLTKRQLSFEGGFNGRTNKLVDSCYNWWQGAVFELFDIAMEGKGNFEGEWLFDQLALQGYALICCQQNQGGMKDKPTTKPDYYHTNYALAGLSVVQHTSQFEELYKKGLTSSDTDGLRESDKSATKTLANDKSSILRRIHPAYCVRFDLLKRCKDYYKDKYGF